MIYKLSQSMELSQNQITQSIYDTHITITTLTKMCSFYKYFKCNINKNTINYSNTTFMVDRLTGQINLTALTHIYPLY